MRGLEPNEVRWRRGCLPFEMTMVKYQLENLLELATGQSALDLGCNDGFITQELCKRFSRVVGVDASEEHIKVARQRIKNAVFHRAMFEEFDPGDELFDTIYMVNVLEHVDSPIDILRRAKEWLNEDGSIVIHVPNALSLNRRIGQLMGIISSYYELSPQDTEVGHRRFYDMDSLRRDIVASDLKVESMGGVLLKPFSHPQMEWFTDCEAWNKELQGWGGKDKAVDWRERLCTALSEIAKELPQYSSPIWARCIK